VRQILLILFICLLFVSKLFSQNALKQKQMLPQVNEIKIPVSGDVISTGHDVISSEKKLNESEGDGTKSMLAPSNDDCSNATTLTVGSSPLCGQTTASATVQSGEVTAPSCGGGTVMNQSVWYKFQATATSMSVWVDNLVSGGCYLFSVVYKNSCIPTAADMLSCNYNTSTDFWHHLTGLIVGNWYYVQVGYKSGAACQSAQTFCISVIAPPTTAGYTQPTTGNAGEYIGTCMTTTCSGQFYDDGGPSSNYSNSVNLIYRTFCPNTAGNCIKATVNYIDLESPYDYLYVNNGPTQNSPNLATVSQVGNGTTYTSTDASGCLTFRFNSDATINYPGWNITLSCVSCTANTLADNNDCISATSICSNSTFTGASVGPGISSEGCSGCNTSEHFTNWYRFCAQINGTLQFLIDPTVNTQDYDFALYGANVTCGSLGTPLRCSYAANTGNTGLRSSSSDASEDVTGDGWISTLNVTAGQCFYLMISQWSAGGSGFTVDFTGSTANLLNCAILPVELSYFDVSRQGKEALIDWTTSSEINNDHFEIERSIDGFSYSVIANLKGKGNSTDINHYTLRDRSPLGGLSYYRLKQVDFDGKVSYSEVKALRMPERNSISIISNDGNNSFSVNINSLEAGKGTIVIYDYSGRIVASQTVIYKESFNTYKLNADHLSSGIYFVTMNLNSEIEKAKFIKD
jgi:hypothetical protein